MPFQLPIRAKRIKHLLKTWGNSCLEKGSTPLVLISMRENLGSGEAVLFTVGGVQRPVLARLLRDMADVVEGQRRHEAWYESREQDK